METRKVAAAFVHGPQKLSNTIVLSVCSLTKPLKIIAIVKLPKNKNFAITSYYKLVLFAEDFSIIRE
jgi:hypothetical protein